MVIVPIEDNARTLSDDRLARLAAGGSRAAFEAIFARHREPLQRYCHSIVGNEHDAADIMQNTMLRVMDALPGDTREIALRPWLYAIAHNEAVSFLRARRSDSGLEQLESHPDHRAAGAVETRDRMRMLTDDLFVLSDQQRSALVMRELGGLDYDELAAVLGVSATAAKQAVYDARHGLQAIAEGRSMSCQAVRATIAGGDRRMLRGLRIRSHLRSCSSCGEVWAARQQSVPRAAAVVPWPALAGVGPWLRRAHGWAGAAAAGTTGGAIAGGIAATLAAVALLAGDVAPSGGGHRALPQAPGTTPLTLPAPTRAIASEGVRSRRPAAQRPHGAAPPRPGASATPSAAGADAAAGAERRNGPEQPPAPAAGADPRATQPASGSPSSARRPRGTGAVSPRGRAGERPGPARDGRGRERSQPARGGRAVPSGARSPSAAGAAARDPAAGERRAGGPAQAAGTALPPSASAQAGAVAAGAPAAPPAHSSAPPATSAGAATCDDRQRSSCARPEPAPAKP